MLRLLSLLIFKLNGWKALDLVKYPSKCLVISAPHTSNWDFLIGRCYGYIQKIRPKYLIKSELFYPILGYLIRLNGGIPVYRNKKNNVVDQIVSLYNKSDNLILGIAPEGTRKYVAKWKTGFYHIALKANVPIMLCKLDFKNKEIGLFDQMKLSGNFDNDMKYIENSFSNISGKIPKNYNSKIY
jgi:1-acyl-sn-glycerol-3-phosphate acyltransferase